MMVSKVVPNVGCALLPFVWAINTVWFFKEAFAKPPFEEQKQIRKYVIMSGIGAVVWMIILAVWIAVFQIHRVMWGEFGENLSFIIPLGRA